jgi:hypothetical protein
MKKLLAAVLVLGTLGGCAIYPYPARVVVAPAAVYYPHYWRY